MARASGRRWTPACASAAGLVDVESRSARDRTVDQSRRARAGSAVAQAGDLELRSGADIARDFGSERAASRSAPGRCRSGMGRAAGVCTRRRSRAHDRRWFARDRVGGEMLRGWRFDVAKPMTLERADALNAVFRQRKGESLLVTHGVEPGLTG